MLHGFRNGHKPMSEQRKVGLEVLFDQLLLEMVMGWEGRPVQVIWYRTGSEIGGLGLKETGKWSSSVSLTASLAGSGPQVPKKILLEQKAVIKWWVWGKEVWRWRFSRSTGGGDSGHGRRQRRNPALNLPASQTGVPEIYNFLKTVSENQCPAKLS